MSLEMKYFVLKPAAKHQLDPYATASQEAMIAYSESIRREDQDFSNELKDWAIQERNLQTMAARLR